MPTKTSELWRARIEQRLLAIWFGQDDSLTGAICNRILSPLAALVALIAKRRRLQIAKRPVQDRPAVIVVGNLVVGGTGKTPLVIALARALQTRGYQVGLIASGYRAKAQTARTIRPESDARTDGDEPVLLALQTGLPVTAAASRNAALQLLEANRPDLDIIISDDGLQHVGLPRTLEFAVFDSRVLGNGKMLPAGPLREPAAHARAMDAILLNGDAELPDVLVSNETRSYRFTIQPDRFMPVKSNHADCPGHQFLSPVQFTRMTAGRRVAAVAGIGRPARFFDSLRSMGLQIDEYPLSDHARIDLDWLDSLPQPLIVMTAKDAVKCREFANERCWMLDVQAHIDPALLDWLEERLSGSSTS